jgi:hypothetical protein
MLYFVLFRCVTEYLFYFCSWPGQNIYFWKKLPDPLRIKWPSPKRYIGGSRIFVLDYRLVKTYFNRIFPVLSLSFFFLPCLVIFALSYVSVSFDISKINCFWNKMGPSLWKCLDPPLRYMYIVVKCGLSSIVEYGTTISVVDCVKLSVLVNQCVRPSYSLEGSIYPEKKNWALTI